MKSAAFIRFLIVLAGLIAIEVICRQGYVEPISLIPPTQMVAKLWDLMHTKAFWSQVSMTLRNITIAAVLSWVLGAVGGVILHSLPRVRHAVEPLIASYYAIPFFVFYPLAVVILGMNAAPIILMAVFFAVVSMITSTMIGLDRIPSVMDKVGKSFRLDRVRTAVMIQFPAALPDLFAGAKLSLGYSVAGVIGSEFILSGEGLGFSIAYAYNDFDSRSMYAYLLFVILFVALLLTIVNLLERTLRYRAGANWTLTSKPKGKKAALPRWAEAIILLVIFFAVWQGVFWFAGREAIASPAMTMRRIMVLVQSDRFYEHLHETVRALWISLLISCLGGAALGIVLGTSRRAGEIVEPMIIALQSTPKVTLYPVMLLFFGLGLAAKVAYGVIHGIIPMTLLTMHAIRSVNPALLRTAKAMRLSSMQTLGTVFIPATVPEVVTAMRLSFSITFLGVIVGELFASQRGLGFLVMNSIGVNDVGTIMAVTVMIGAFAVIVNGVLLAIDKRMHR